MNPKRILFVLAACILCGCQKELKIEVGPIYTLGPTRTFQSEEDFSFFEFHYNIKDSEDVHILVGSDLIKTINISGKGMWRVELINSMLTATGDTVIFEIPTNETGIIKPNVGVNDLKQMIFNITIGDNVVATIVCPNQIIGAKRK